MAEATSQKQNGSTPSVQIPNGPQTRTILWCVPRSCSTALTKCLSFCKETEVWFEPYTYCKATTDTVREVLGLHLPHRYKGNEEKFRQAGDLFDKICHCKVRPEYLSFASIGKFLESSSERHVFVKDMAYAITPNEYNFLPAGYKHAFLIRHPLRVFRSWRKAMFAQHSALGLLKGEAAVEETYDLERDCPYLNSGGLMFKDTYDIWKYVCENLDSDPIVIDGDDLLSKPAKVLPKFCEAIGFPYDESLLSWDASAEITKSWKLPADGLVGNLAHLYGTAILSGEFLEASQPPSRDEVTADVLRCSDEIMKYYEEMYEARTK
ncbi:uncharacterized protein LOC129259014 [Lytechinus pictus]|uniref:uncharacterized protein LOC129259014 n=1 Tax=Lytechinus pictus TaxID=7653 RepID=UPI0030BA1084